MSSGKSGILISTTNKSLRDNIVLICSPIKRVCKSVSSDFFIDEKSNEAVEDVATGKSIYTYYTPVNKSREDIDLDIAIIYPKANMEDFTVKFDEKNNILIDDNNLKTVISSCTSTEGIHVYSDSKDIHLYYSLGYEIRANCSKEVYK
ncbi:hypothetical protein PD335_005106 [Salmonella enterica]|uniref:Uncharacterized protein n=1 Tax=Salmonella enterica subsp. enterica serovar Lattenkamp TaxID=2564671 RepID=A0A734GBH2_SALET|nr:hypothetical protein [Salmonella enterica]EBG2478062.1 hypothetical protein [Salmonella enterica subsp. enterica serovar Lattenkamp]EDS3899507.1 hypothetical protein [Salmonella enterica subsp. enterica]EAW5735706.1 hypothetical protein [Salmonella enterica]EBC3925934.1 hypothetical protein [Salmonella enterica]